MEDKNRILSHFSARSCFRGLVLIFIIMFGMLIEMSSALAQHKKGPRKTEINFEDELIEGGEQKPELFYLLQKKQFNYKRLIKLRDNFLPEMKSTAQEIKRTGSRN